MSIKQITQLPASTTLASTDVLAKETSGNTTQKITAQNIADSVKTLASLVDTTEMNAAIAQSTVSGSNANGAYVKFVDGTMICYNIISPFTFTANSTRTETHNFPAAFISAPVVTLNINTTIPDKLSLSCYGVSTTQYVLNAVSTFSADQGPAVWMMAIGRWK